MQGPWWMIQLLILRALVVSLAAALAIIALPLYLLHQPGQQGMTDLQGWAVVIFGNIALVVGLWLFDTLTPWYTPPPSGGPGGRKSLPAVSFL